MILHLKTYLELWGDRIGEQINKANPKNICSIRLKQAIFYLNATLCLINKCGLSVGDVGTICILTVQAKNLYLDDHCNDAELKAVESKYNHA